MNKKKQITILNRLYEKNIITKKLIFNSSFELLIFVLLSAQATDIIVNEATSKLYKIANTPKKILALGIDGIKYYIKKIGLSNIKAKNIIETCKILINKYNGEIPENREALESLPGVGRKTANIILNTVFGWPTIAVDTHVFRVCNRTNLASGKNVIKVEEKLLKIIPFKFKFDCHHLLISHGRYTCIARKPRCESCIIEDLCEFKNKQYQNLIINK
ncbi:MAG: endonuclease III [Arsenophonus sp. ET-YP4-MAG3]